MHEFFVAWFNGVLDDDDATFARLADVLHPDFSMVTPSGEWVDRAGVLAQLRGAHASTDASAPVRIEIRNLVHRVVGDDAALVTYEEWQFAAGRLLNGRTSSAYFVRAQAAPNGVLWRHLHETLLTSD